MQLTVVLAVGLDSSLLAGQSADWKSAGFVVIWAASIREVIVHFQDGDFDLVLLDDGILPESRERMTFLIRASGSRIPLVYITDTPRTLMASRMRQFEMGQLISCEALKK
jgi:DNA-binding response OmpR family regulator